MLVTVTGCWDSRELDTLFIVTGLGLDASGKPDEVDVNVQIVKIAGGSSSSGGQQSSGGSSGGSIDGGNSILLGASGKSVLAAVSTLRHESTRTLFLHHNQMIVFGKELAQSGVQKYLDFFLRDEETRMETLVLVSDDKAKDVLSAELDQDKLSGVAVSRIMRQFSTISIYLSVNMLNLVSKLLQKTTAPTLPIVKVIKDGQKTKLDISKMAVFKGDRMVGELNWDEITGYLWTMGEINDGTLEIANEKGTVAMNILQVKSNSVPVIEKDGRAGVILNIDTVLDIEELNGFRDMELKDLYVMLIQEATKTIEQRVNVTFDKTQQMGSDIYGYGGLFHIKYPRQWKNIEQQWDMIYPSLQLALNVNVQISGTGKTAFTMDMKESKK
jgi:spore germination protein KC